MRRQSAEADRFLDLLVKLYGEERGRNFRYAEALAICEYHTGRRPMSCGDCPILQRGAVR